MRRDYVFSVEEVNGSGGVCDVYGDAGI